MAIIWGNCFCGDTPKPWNTSTPTAQRGPTGPTGPTGPVGPAGPQGVAGVDGEDGETPTLRIGTVTTGQPGTQASASITGTPPDYVLNLTIPQGPTGSTG